MVEVKVLAIPKEIRETTSLCQLHIIAEDCRALRKHAKTLIKFHGTDKLCNVRALGFAAIAHSAAIAPHASE
jgi:hypothetical protein